MARRDTFWRAALRAMEPGIVATITVLVLIVVAMAVVQVFGS